MSIAALISILNSNYLQRQEEQRKEEQRKQEELVAELLLLRGENDFMLIGATETVLMIQVHKSNNAWFATVNEEKIRGDSFGECFQKVIQKCGAKGVQTIPFSVNKRIGDVDGYWLMIKIDDVKKLEKEASLNNLADRLTEEIKTAW